MNRFPFTASRSLQAISPISKLRINRLGHHLTSKRTSLPYGTQSPKAFQPGKVPFPYKHNARYLSDLVDENLEVYEKQHQFIDLPSGEKGRKALETAQSYWLEGLKACKAEPDLPKSQRLLMMWNSDGANMKSTRLFVNGIVFCQDDEVGKMLYKVTRWKRWRSGLWIPIIIPFDLFG
jgi:hypothetical protein